MFQRLDVMVGGRTKRCWCIDLIREEWDGTGEPYVMAELSEENGGKNRAETTRVRRVAG